MNEVRMTKSKAPRSSGSKKTAGAKRVTKSKAKSANKTVRKKSAAKATKKTARTKSQTKATTKKARAKTPKSSRKPSAKAREHALTVLETLSKEFPDARCALDHETPHQLLTATILSAQCTDARVNLVTKDLFRKYPTPEAFAMASQAEMEKDVKSTGFFRNKARAIIEMSQDIVHKHGGEIPRTMEELTALRGVGRKTANVLLGNAFGIPGLVVDTHVKRISNLLGFTKQSDPVKIEFELNELFPESWWTISSHLLILHGRRTCIARRPKCVECPIQPLCPSSQV